ncbi:RnfH family protein [Pseudaeromonas sharmana]|uniref:UPF0125 protein ACFOSS_14495 n=1 Tax=Pseudaeromonas sharmana TaxID=328412 RepID=A0ABV8CRI5_9GAMM
MSELIRAEVVYALPQKQTLLVVKLVAGSTVRDAIQASGLLQRVPELVLETLKVGIYSRLVSLDTLLRGGERIEVYRPLTADPRAMRKQRADKAKERGG